MAHADTSTHANFGTNAVKKHSPPFLPTPDTNLDANTNTNTDAHTNANTHTHTNTDTHTNTYINTNTHTNDTTTDAGGAAKHSLPILRGSLLVLKGVFAAVTMTSERRVVSGPGPFALDR